ncbi:tripartite tricarboxylate transporter substrate binding protein [Cupriavidus pauculus]|uniref:Bug family tripartite tricarboxylate transporter substrate binding protein n=1 Tax=Cupriavidus pauculus TaxID=82633 RepID=UPI001EE3295C|nr:tripartite tricarboxylate transporter substrate binding protein [Cupriavidus pauculus]GJG94319.1 tripartite tricarboxylate transporter substrate binding protein [Cupriavidus pauculus]
MHATSRLLVICLFIMSAAMGFHPANAAEAPLRVIVPYPAGGSGDAVARMLTDGLREQLGRTVIIENKPGANGRIALLTLKNAPADGSTIVLAFSGVLVNAIIFQNAKGMDFKTDFIGLAQVGSMPAALAVPYAHKASSIAEFVRIRRLEGDFPYGMQGSGSVSHLAGLRFAAAAKLNANPIGYQGGAPMANDLMGNQLDAGIDTAGDFVERHKAKKLKVLGVFGYKRFPLLPDVPTMAEQGFPNVEAEIWLGFIGSSKLADAWTNKFQAALKKTMEKPETKEKIAKLVNVEYKSREDFSKVMAKDFEVWTPLLSGFGLINK